MRGVAAVVRTRVELAVAGIEAVDAVGFLSAHEYRRAVLYRKRDHAALPPRCFLKSIADGLRQEPFGGIAAGGASSGLAEFGRYGRDELVGTFRLAAVHALADASVVPLVLDDPVNRGRRPSRE